ncbi:MAG TPA: hypothetical protein VEW28_02425 [Candidatus Kapabacteria bacterium]|nr:hypothetical protein [Candidatus Kapabacteria bacterium]
MYKIFFFLSAVSLSVALFSCCDPKPRNSYPAVIDSSFSYRAIKDAFTLSSGSVDSLYYPVYSMNITNTGSDADSFQLVIDPLNGYLPLTVSEFVQPGETKLFKTYGPLASNALDSAKQRYYGFAFSTPDSMNLTVIRPSVTIAYGNSITGPESCGSPGTTLTVNIDSLGKK